MIVQPNLAKIRRAMEIWITLVKLEGSVFQEKANICSSGVMTELSKYLAIKQVNY